MIKRKHSAQDRADNEVHEALDRASTLDPDQLAYCHRYEVLNEHVISARTKTMVGEKELHDRYNLGLIPEERFKIFMELVVDHLIPPDTIDRLELELTFAEKLQFSIDKGIAEARAKEQAKSGLSLPDGARTPSGIVLPPGVNNGDEP